MGLQLFASLVARWRAAAAEHREKMEQMKQVEPPEDAGYEYP